ncbi:MAG: DUF4249 family protein [Bacteroidota bacterium]
MLVLLCALSACEKETLDKSNTASLPVVSAYLQAGQTPLVKISRQVPYGAEDNSSLLIDGLAPVIENKGQSYPLTQNADGYYAGDGTWKPQAGETYRLSFSYKGLTVSAETLIPAPPLKFKASASSIKIVSFSPGSGSGIPTFPDPIKLTWDNEEGDYFQVGVQNIEADPVKINDTGDNPPGPNFSTSPEQTNEYELGFMSFTYYGTHRIVLYRVNTEYVTLTKNSTDNSQNLSAPYTNVTNGLGIFTGVGADTLFVEVTK